MPTEPTKKNKTQPEAGSPTAGKGPQESRGKGRPPVADKDKTNLQFHLIMMKEEKQLFTEAARIVGVPLSGFLRMAIRAFFANPQSKDTIDPALLPAIMYGVDKVSSHYPLLLSESDRMLLVHNSEVGGDAGQYSPSIRTAALIFALNLPVRSPEFEKALIDLKIMKGAK